MKLLIALGVIVFVTMVTAFKTRLCQGNCDQPLDTNAPCQCNSACIRYNDCCSDYYQCDSSAGARPTLPSELKWPWQRMLDGKTLTEGAFVTPTTRLCRGVCDAKYDRNAPCQCNARCPEFANCCSDYTRFCNVTPVVRPTLPSQPRWPWQRMLVGKTLTPRASTDFELEALSESLWRSDVNRGSTSDVQFSTNQGSKLFKYVNPSVLNRPTFVALRALLDNYIAEVGTSEPSCAQCRREEDAFIDAVLDTDVMKQAWDFLVMYNLASSNRNAFAQQLKDTWFKVYSRSKGRAMDSSGFEHVFVGEIKNGKVSGFHNWVQYYQEENEGETELFSERERCQPAPVLTVSHNWQGAFKEIGGWYMRTSPEFEMAIYTVCFNIRKNSRCNLLMDGYRSAIQTYDFNGVSPRTVATAYPMC